ncbi:MAG: hypothetical protein NC342_03760 [Pseudoflavonifractor sp.]|nr:hypothetical protein [Alloprevotella sp.]MCM1116630.1 hypothetical protein [Pseudoflavonifractor sp.]
MTDTEPRTKSRAEREDGPGPCVSKSMSKVMNRFYRITLAGRKMFKSYWQDATAPFRSRMGAAPQLIYFKKPKYIFF